LSQAARELAAVVIVALAALAGVAFDLVTPPPAAPLPDAPSPLLVQRTSFCPPGVEGVDADARLALGSIGREAVPVRIGPPARDLALDPGRLVLARPPTSGGSSVSGFGDRVPTQGLVQTMEPVEGVAAVACSERASPRWYFAAGSSELAFDERLVVSNPFLDEAVVRVTFYTPRGPRAKANLADVAVPSGEAVEIAANDFIASRQELLAAAIDVVRGRVVAWRNQVRKARGVSGVETSLGAHAPAAAWYFADGWVGSGYDERIALLNPGPEEALVTITLAGQNRVIQPPRLVELSVPPGTARSVSLAEEAPQPRAPQPAGVLVTSVNGAGIIAERTVTYDRKDISGVAAEVGSTRPGRGWWVGPVVLDPAGDALSILNPGARAAVVKVTLSSSGRPPLEPGALARIRVPAGLTRRISLRPWTRARPAAALVTSDRPVVVERSGYLPARSDVATVLGLPLPPPEAG
jgi:hypothetical protein